MRWGEDQTNNRSCKFERETPRTVATALMAIRTEAVLVERLE